MYFLNKLRVQGKINIITTFVVLSLGILAVEIWDRLKNLDRMYQNTLKIENLSTTILRTLEEGLQVTSALIRGTILNPLDEKAKESFIKSVNDFEPLLSKLEKSQNISESFRRLQIQRV